MDECCITSNALPAIMRSISRYSKLLLLQDSCIKKSILSCSGLFPGDLSADTGTNAMSQWYWIEIDVTCTDLYRILSNNFAAPLCTQLFPLALDMLLPNFLHQSLAPRCDARKFGICSVPNSLTLWHNHFTTSGLFVPDLHVWQWSNKLLSLVHQTSQGIDFSTTSLMRCSPRWRDRYV